MSEQYSYILKIIVIGPKDSGKTVFIKGDGNATSLKYFDYTCPVGINFAIATIELSNNTRCKLQIWDLKANYRLKEYYPSFFRGAAACILCFDLSNHTSFEDLPFWLNLVRNCRTNIPISLVGTKSDLTREVSYAEINKFLVKHGLNAFYLVSPQMPFKRDVVFKQLTQILIDEYDKKIPTKEKEIFYEFVQAFNKCPICKNENHKEYLKNFFLSKNPESIRLKKRLLVLIKDSRNYYNKITLGIPCCNCFKLVFE